MRQAENRRHAAEDTLPESRAEVRRGLEMVEFVCGVPSMLMGDTLANIAAEVDAETMRHPVGVPAPMVWFPFTGWNQSFFGDLHLQRTESVHFYAR